MTPLTKRRFAMANIERPKHAANSGRPHKDEFGRNDEQDNARDEAKE